jgi:hypothetical protein
MEIYRSDMGDDRMHFLAVASLIRAVRDFNERFADSDIRVLAAVRSEVVAEVALVQGEVYKIANSLGTSIGWSDTVRGDFHPLEQIVLKAIAAQHPEIALGSEDVRKEDIRKAFSIAFPKDYSLSNALDYTWYRPRDINLLFEAAQKADHGRQAFRSQTLKRYVLPTVGERMLADAKSGLLVRYKPKEVAAMDRMLRGGYSTYSRAGFFERVELLSHQYDDVALLSDTRWIDVLEDMYRVGIVHTISAKTGHKNFGFRGDPMPSFTDDFHIGIHQSLLSELSIAER